MPAPTSVQLIIVARVARPTRFTAICGHFWGPFSLPSLILTKNSWRVFFFHVSIPVLCASKCIQRFSYCCCVCFVFFLLLSVGTGLKRVQPWFLASIRLCVCVCVSVCESFPKLPLVYTVTSAALPERGAITNTRTDADGQLPRPRSEFGFFFLVFLLFFFAADFYGTL